jgi:hypothetical protein
VRNSDPSNVQFYQGVAVFHLKIVAHRVAIHVVGSPSSSSKGHCLLIYVDALVPGIDCRAKRAHDTCQPRKNF